MYEELNMKRPFLFWLLVFLLIFLGVGGLYGGLTMMMDPGGHTLHMESILPLLPVSSLFLPGLFLVIVMGFYPLLMAYGMIWHPIWPWANRVTVWSRHYWAWTGALTVGALLVLWLIFQILVIGFRWPIQYINLINAILIVGVALHPRTQKFFEGNC